MKKNYLIVILSCLFLGACSSGQKRLEQGDYDVAVYKAVKRLQQKPNHAKAEKVLKDAYLLAVKEHMNRASFQDKTENPFKYDGMVDEYTAVDRLNNAIRKYPQYNGLLKLVDVQEELLITQISASQSHIAKGDELMALNEKRYARDAFSHYLTANSFIQNAVSQLKIDRAQEAGTVNVRLEFADRRSFFKDYNATMVYNRIRSEFRDSRYRFLRVVEPSDIRLEIDELVQIEMEEVQIGRVDVNKSVFEMLKEDVYMGEAKTDSGEVVEVYGTVSADYIEFCKTVNTNARILVQRLDGRSSTVLQSIVFPSSYMWTEKWATYRGDKRALTASQLQFVNHSEPGLPAPQWLFSQTAKPLAGKSINYLRDEYSYLR